MTDNDTDQRGGYIAGLRALADLLEQTPELPLPNTRGVDWYLFSGVEPLALEEQKAEAARLVRLLPGQQDKQETGALFRFVGQIGGLRTEVIVDRSAVCERVVTGTREVTREVVVPVETRTETVTETVEEVRWECRPLLAPVVESVVA